MQSGLKPTVRGLKGLGFGRALPAAFGFGNGFSPDGFNDIFQGARFNGIGKDSELTLEFWLKRPADFSEVIFYWAHTSNQIQYFFGFGNGTCRIDCLNTANASLRTVSFGSSGNFVNGARVHYAIRMFGSGVMMARNGNLAAQITGDPVGSSMSSFPNGTPLTEFRIGGSQFSGTDANQIRSQIDDFRVYKRYLSNAEITANYNNGIGENPQNVIGLDLWYTFQSFETLDFSEAQDNSDIGLGLRDFSGKNRHARAVNMDTNPASPTYVLKPF